LGLCSTARGDGDPRGLGGLEREWFPKVEETVKPYLTTPITFKYYMVETTLCEHFEKALTA
jgi:hypothetical protein